MSHAAVTVVFLCKYTVQQLKVYCPARKTTHREKKTASAPTVLVLLRHAVSLLSTTTAYKLLLPQSFNKTFTLHFSFIRT